MAEEWTPDVSERVAQFALYPTFQQRCFYFFMQLANQAGTPQNVQNWAFNNGVSSYSAYMMVAQDASVTQGVQNVEPWDMAEANRRITDGALFAAVNAQWQAIQEAAGLVPAP